MSNKEELKKALARFENLHCNKDVDYAMHKLGLALMREGFDFEYDCDDLGCEGEPMHMFKLVIYTPFSDKAWE